IKAFEIFKLVTGLVTVDATWRTITVSGTRELREVSHREKSSYVNPLILEDSEPDSTIESVSSSRECTRLGRLFSSPRWFWSEEVFLPSGWSSRSALPPMQLQICLGRLLRSLRMSAQLSGSDTDPRSVLRIARLFVLSVAFSRLQACVCDLSWSAWPYTTPTYFFSGRRRHTIWH